MDVGQERILSFSLMAASIRWIVKQVKQLLSLVATVTVNGQSPPSPQHPKTAGKIKLHDQTYLHLRRPRHGNHLLPAKRRRPDVCSMRASKSSSSPMTTPRKKSPHVSRNPVSPSKVCASNKPTTTPKKSARACNGCSPTCAASAARAASTPKPWTATSGKSGRRTAGNSVWAFGFRPR